MRGFGSVRDAGEARGRGRRREGIEERKGEKGGIS